MFGLVLPIVAALNYVILQNQWLNTLWIEKYYSLGFNRILVSLLSQVTGKIPFSLAEALVYLHVLLLIGFALKCRSRKILVRGINYLALIYLLFLVTWGYNYARSDLGITMGLEVTPMSVEDLITLNKHLIDKANQLRTVVEEDENGVMKTRGYKTIFKQAQLGYDALDSQYAWLKGQYGKPKAVGLSQWMLYTGITGVYFPFTGEANVNVAIPDLLLPATVLHEMAHQRGVAAEDEANFIAYIVGIKHPDKVFNYSSTVLGLIYAMNALNEVDPTAASELRKLYAPPLKRDFIANSMFWKAYEGKTNEVADRVNDAYLKSNAQASGVKSYGEMIDLMLAYYDELGLFQ